MAESQSLPSRKNTIFRIWYKNVKKNVLCLVPECTMLCFAPIILQRVKCAITLRTMHELLGADSTMYFGYYLGLLQVRP